MTNEEAREILHQIRMQKCVTECDYSCKLYESETFCLEEKALDMAIKALEIELLTDNEQRIFLKAMSREREVCQNVDDEYADDDTKVSLVKICNEIERKVKKIWES